MSPNIPPQLQRRPSAARVAAGAVLIAALLGGGALAAYAAEPGASTANALERLPSEVQGVVGSGDQLSLRLKDSAGGRTLKPGDAYAQGWTLKGVTASTATLTRNGEDRVVGLNPDGRVADAATPVGPSSVTVAGIPDKATIDRYVAMGFAKFGPSFMAPTDDPDKRRSAAYMMMIQEDAERRAAAVQAAGGNGRMVGSNSDSNRALLGEAAYKDFTDLMAKSAAEMRAQEAADLAARPITGPSSYYLPAGGNTRTIQAAAGVDPRGVWQIGPPDAQGGRTMTRIADSSLSPSVIAAQAANAAAGAAEAAARAASAPGPAR